jgi:hypothetical protein
MFQKMTVINLLFLVTCILLQNLIIATSQQPTCSIPTITDSIEKGEFDVEIIQQCLKTSDTDGKISHAVKYAIESGKRRLDALLNAIVTIKRDQSPQLEPAFQWAQSATDLFINVKMAHKIDAPACIDILDSSTKIQDTKIAISAQCKDKKFAMEIELFGEIDPTNSSFSFTSVGRGVFFLRKGVKAKWARLEYDGKRKQRLWHEKQEQYKDELKDITELFTPIRTNTNNGKENNDGITTPSETTDTTTTTTTTTTQPPEKDEFDVKAEAERIKLRQNAERKSERVMLDAEAKKTSARKEFDEKIQKIDEEVAIKKNRIITQLKTDLDEIGVRTKEAREKNSFDVFGMLSEMLKAWDKDEL